MQPSTALQGRCPRQRHLGPAPRTGSTWGPGQCQVLGGTCPQSCALLVHSGHRPQVPITRLCPPQPGASWIADCTRLHCSSTPLGAVLVRSPISCPPLNETECAKVSASHLSLQHGWRPGVLAVLVVVAGRGRGVFWCGDVWKECFPGTRMCPATLTPPYLHISPCIFALNPSYCIRTHHTSVSRCTQTYTVTHSQHTHIHTNMGSQPLTGTTHSTGPLTPHQASAQATHQGTLAHMHHTDVLLSPAVS